MTRSATLQMLVSLAGAMTLLLDDENTGQSSANPSVRESVLFANGNGAGQANRLWHKKSRALVADTPEDLDLYDLGTEDIGAGAGKDALGQSFANDRLKALYIYNKGAGVVKIGGNGQTTAFNSIFDGDDDAKIVLPSESGILLWNKGTSADYAIADVTNHLLQLEAISVAGEVDILMLFADV